MNAINRNTWIRAIVVFSGCVCVRELSLSFGVVRAPARLCVFSIHRRSYFPSRKKIRILDQYFTHLFHWLDYSTICFDMVQYTVVTRSVPYLVRFNLLLFVVRYVWWWRTWCRFIHFNTCDFLLTAFIAPQARARSIFVIKEHAVSTIFSPDNIWTDRTSQDPSVVSCLLPFLPFAVRDSQNIVRKKSYLKMISLHKWFRIFDSVVLLMI